LYRLFFSFAAGDEFKFEDDEKNDDEKNDEEKNDKEKSEEKNARFFLAIDSDTLTRRTIPRLAKTQQQKIFRTSDILHFFGIDLP